MDEKANKKRGIKVDLLAFVAHLRDSYKKFNQRRYDQVEEKKSLPFLYSLFSISLSSGQNIEQTLKAISHCVPSCFELPIRNTLKEIDLGATFPQAVLHMEEVEILRPLTHVMLETYDLGNNSVWIIDSMNKDAMATIKRETEIAIKKLPITMLLPLVLCILPAFIFLSVLPILINGVLSINW